MIIGHGDIACVLKDRRDLIFFASGLSNSKEKKESQYQPEKDLLLSQDRAKHLVYFGSLCIFYSNSRYAKHKRQMEELVKKNFPHYTILRMGNITWGKNPHTLINYLRAQAQKGKRLKIKNVYRYLVDKKELLHWLAMIPSFNSEMNITGQRFKVVEIVEKYVYTKKGRNA